jgi:hypothetical protein
MTADPQGRGLPPHPVAQPLRRCKAFAVPQSYVYDAIRGYQLNDPQFSIYRIKPGLIPLDAKMIFIDFNPRKHEFYFVLEHESFDEYQQGTPCPEIPIEIEAVPVTMGQAEEPKAPDLLAPTEIKGNSAARLLERARAMGVKL